MRVGNAFTHPAVSRTLLAGIAACLLAATLSGIALDRGRTVGLAAGGQAVVAARSDEHRPERAHPGREREDGGGVLGEAHEAVSDLLVLVVGLHVAYLLAFKRPLARFMLFLDGGETARTPGKPALTTGPAGPAGVR
ncbi:hypothetical protein [Dankookia sp. P2]|uniref:hypothetical protein n=1 Tax=Dankookia sp. P2 TaxID=3423955 RepID=UPI003D6657D6